MYPSSSDENNGINAISEEFNWKKEEKKLIYKLLGGINNENI